MAQIFPRWANKTPLFGLAGAAVAALVVPGAIWYWFSPEFTDVGYRPVQPVEYSHALHAGELGLDCRFCHSTVERSANASVPAVEVCMACHQVVKRDSPLIAPLVAAWNDGVPIRWVRVHKIPEYAYFDHSVHIAAGVGCSSCHGRIDQMAVVQQAKPLSMGWCLECHRNPDAHLRRPDEITDMAWEPGPDQAEFVLAVREERGLAPPQDCTACHH